LKKSYFELIFIYLFIYLFISILNLSKYNLSKCNILIIRHLAKCNLGKCNSPINNIDLKLCHAGLGHYQNLQKFFENNNIKKEKNDNINCEDYKISKLKKKPFNKTTNKSTITNRTY